MKIKDFCVYAPKSSIKAGDAEIDGKYMFFTSSSDETKRYTKYQFEGEGIIMGTGGNATLHYYCGKYSVSTDCVVLLPDNRVKCKYLYYFFLAKIDILEAGFKGAGLKHTNKEYIGNIDFGDIPPISRQLEVINIFDKISNIINARQKEKDYFDDLIKARFVEMFERESFISKSILEVSIFCSRGKSPQYVDFSNIHVINQACVYWDKVKYENVKYNEESYNGNKLLHTGDILINSTGTGTLGRCNIFVALGKYMFMADSHITILRLSEDILPIYFKEWFATKNSQDYIYSNCVSGSTNQIELSKEKLLKMPIPVPPMALQNDFAEFVKQVDKSKFAVQKAKEQAQLLFDSLMQEYFA